MAVTVNELTTEVTVEPARELGGVPPAVSQAKELTAIHTELAAIMRLDLRTRAESFDD
jgi:hypothetical protein